MPLVMAALPGHCALSNLLFGTSIYFEPHHRPHAISCREVDGDLYELDGRKASAINHGPSSAESLLADAVGVVKQFMARDPEELRFTVVALAPVSNQG